MAIEQKAGPVEFPVLAGGWCNWHDGPSGTALVVQWAESNSGPPKPLYACAPCREQRGLSPAPRLPCRSMPVPPTGALTWEQVQGRACVACGAGLTATRVLRSVVMIQQDGFGLDFEIYACGENAT